MVEKEGKEEGEEGGEEKQTPIKLIVTHIYIIFIG
jgi:hypothetical protein